LIYSTRIDDHTLEEISIMADSPQIIAWLKPVCGWSNGIREVFRKYGLQFDDRDIINNPDIYAEMVQKSGQPLSPCVEINGQVLADVSGEEVEAWMVENKIVEAVAV
jgi:monothiol glutaredoxin